MQDTERQDIEWLEQAERKLRDAVIDAVSRGDWQAAWEDVTIGRAVFNRPRPRIDPDRDPSSYRLDGNQHP